MNFEPKYVNEDDFKEYFGKDLKELLNDDDNISNKSNSFLYRVEARLISYVNAVVGKNIEYIYDNLSDYQKERLKLAILEQTYYVLRNSDISTDSGYDPDSGIIADKEELKQLVVCQNTINYLIEANLWNRRIKSRGGLYYGYWY